MVNLGIGSVIANIYFNLTGRRSYTQFVKLLDYPTNLTTKYKRYLGPVIFLLFINKLPGLLKYSKCLFHADDMKIFCSFKEVEHIGLLQYDLDVLSSALSIHCEMFLYFLNTQTRIYIYNIYKSMVFESHSLCIKMKMLKKLNLLPCAQDYNLHILNGLVWVGCITL